MNSQQFIEALNELDDSQLQEILDGQGLIVYQDAGLTTGRSDAAFVIYELGEDPYQDTASLKAALTEQADTLIDEYYQFNPLSKEYFNKELIKMLQELGWDAFLQQPGEVPNYKLFVEKDQLVAEDSSSMRFKYGSCLELDQKFPATALQNKAKNWVQSGSAYEGYITTNVCRWSAWED